MGYVAPVLWRDLNIDLALRPVEVFDAFGTVHLVEVFEILLHRVCLCVQQEIVQNLAPQILVHKQTVEEGLNKKFLLFDDVGFRFRQPSAPLKEGNLSAREEFPQECAECLHVFESAFDFDVQGVGGDPKEDIVGHERVRVDDFVTTHYHLVLTV